MVKAFMVAALLLTGVSVASAAEIGGDGLHKEDWFFLSFRDIREDMDTARAEGKGLVLVFEQRGCIYCAKMHEDILSDGEVRDFIRSNFKVVQYNLFGSEEVTDLDGKSLVEKTAARRWNVVFTPTIIFLPETAPKDVTVAQAAVATMPGAFGKQTFLHMFQWVHEKGYATDEHFQKYHARKLDEMRAQGANPGE